MLQDSGLFREVRAPLLLFFRFMKNLPDFLVELVGDLESGPVSAPHSLNVDGCVVLKTLPDVFSRQIPSEYFLDSCGCPLLQILHPFLLHLPLCLRLRVLHLKVPLAVRV
jgi:hypothetical protein